MVLAGRRVGAAVESVRPVLVLHAPESLFKVFLIPDAIGMRHPYPSDISREQFETILPLLESARKKTA
ncbi:MAG: hypothetical protein QM612_10175, partial [Thermomonas sp.]